jgi:hypothetical protein
MSSAIDLKGLWQKTRSRFFIREHNPVRKTEWIIMAFSCRHIMCPFSGVNLIVRFAGSKPLFLTVVEDGKYRSQFSDAASV